MSLPSLIMIAVHTVLTAVLASVVAVAGYSILFDVLRTDRAETLQSYIQVRAEREQILFREARALNQAAAGAFRRRLAALDDSTVEAEFDILYPDHGDGTRRSAPALFDGQVMPDGDYVFGIGAFIADEADLTLADKRRLLAAFHVVRSTGEAYLGQFTSFYYFTPDRRIVMFAPDREDRLAFYRSEAPADFNLQADEDPRLFSLESNPNNVMQCTRLSRYVYSSGGERAATACRLPVRDEETLLGAFGTSIQMTGHIAEALEAPPSHGVNMLFDREGAIIARGQVSLVTDRLPVDPVDVMALLEDDPRPRGIVHGPDANHLVAFSRVDGPDWYFVSVVGLTHLKNTAMAWAWTLFALVFLVSLAFTAIRGLMRRLVAARLSAA